MKYIIFFTLLFCMSSCDALLKTTAEYYHFDEIRPGLTTDQVRKILGRPEFTGFNEQQETWEYECGAEKNVRAIVTFTNGLVTSFNSYRAPMSSVVFPVRQRDQQQLYVNTLPNERPQHHHSLLMSNKDFSSFIRSYQQQSFDSDRMNMVQTAAKTAVFTCEQVAAILKTGSFDNERLEVLRLLAPRICDPQHSHVFLNVFTFSSSRETAANILLAAQRE